MNEKSPEMWVNKMEDILFSVCHFRYKSQMALIAINVRACPWKRSGYCDKFFFRLMSRVLRIVRGGLQLAGHPTRVAPRPARQLHLSPITRDLTEFFEVEKFRGEKTIRVGREWR